MELLLLPLGWMGVVFITAPFAAFVPGAAFAGLFWFRRRRTVLLAAALWIGYGVYETGMYQRWWCTGECNIRVDLLLIYPLLLAVSAVALWLSVRR